VPGSRFLHHQTVGWGEVAQNPSPVSVRGMSNNGWGLTAFSSPEAKLACDVSRRSGLARMLLKLTRGSLDRLVHPANFVQVGVKLRFHVCEASASSLCRLARPSHRRGVDGDPAAGQRVAVLRQSLALSATTQAINQRMPTGKKIVLRKKGNW